MKTTQKVKKNQDDPKIEDNPNMKKPQKLRIPKKQAGAELCQAKQSLS